MDMHVSRRQLLHIGTLASVLAVAGCTGDEPDDDDEEDADTAPDTYAEPAIPPDAVSDGFDIEAMHATTIDAIESVPFTIVGHATEWQDDAHVWSEAMQLEGDGTRGYFIHGMDESAPIGTAVEQAADWIAHFFDGSHEWTHTPDGTVDHREATYDQYTQLIVLLLEDLAAAGDAFSFQAPAWDDERGVYTIAADGYDGPEDITISHLVVTLSRDGVLIGIDTELASNGDTLEMYMDSEMDAAVDISVPDWVADAERD